MSRVIDYREQDEDARRVIKTELRETLFVEAGAGTGKTRALVDRIVALVCDGITIDRVAAITFTERAAAELRERVRSGLEEERRERPEKSDVIGKALDSLDRAQISTIHSFCQAIVRTYAPEAGVDPDFAVQDEVMTQRRMQERWRRYLETLGEDEQAKVEIDRVMSLGLRFGELEELALGLASRGELAEILEEHPLTEPEPAWPNLDPMIARLIATGYESVPMNDFLAARIAGVLAVIRAIVDRPENEREELLAAGSLALGNMKKGNSNTAWGGAGPKDAAIGEVEAVQDQLNQLLEKLRAAALADVMPRLQAFVRIDERDRGRDGSLTFDDLILRARRLLAAGGTAVESLRHRYDALLIDEFQDTDPMQVEIATAFATDPKTGQIEPGRLFLVGDPKQSIYRFRRADMATYAHTAERMEEAGARFPKLALNRRSRSEILGWVNELFDRMIGAGDEPTVQPPYAAIYPDRDADLQGAGVATFGGSMTTFAREVRRIEAEQLAALCRRVIDEKWQVQERDKSIREASYKDVAILIPRRTGLIAMERAMAAAGVPYRVESGSLIYRTQEVTDLINCLTAIDDPADEVAIVAALRSPAFACSDVDLARHRAAGGRFNYHHPELEKWEGPVGEGLRALGEFHRSRHNTSLAALVERFVFARGTIETGVLDQRDRNSFRRARFTIERARTFEAAGPESLRAFVSWLDNQADAQIMDNEGASVDEDEDAVRILTIHGAKGLEFPIVFLAGLSAAPITGRAPLYSADFTGDRVAVCAGTKGDNRLFKLGDFDDLNGAEAVHLNAEFDRTLYVASTRARDHLVVSLFHSSRASGCAAKRLIENGAEELADHIEIVDVAPAADVRALDGLAVEIPDGIDGGNFDAERAALVARARTAKFTSATKLKLEVGGDVTAAPEDEKPAQDDETEPWARGRAGTRIGRSVHAAIQSLRFDASDEAIAAISRAQAVAQAIPHRVRDVERLVRWVVRESDAWKRAARAEVALREIPFGLEFDGTVLEGFIDLVLQTDEGIEIVDWKTDQISADDVKARLDQYRLQAGLYVYGLEAATGQKVARVTYVFASPKVEQSLGDPAELALAAREALGKSRAA